MILTWSAFALQDRDSIFTFIELENTAASILVDFPASGRVGRIAATRELVISGTRYLAAYTIIDATVRVLRVLHGAQEWPESFQSLRPCLFSLFREHARSP
ncbi:type II toxin-antitoxin system RelE/ParE family toxin [Rhizobium skierniewicense]|uniref:type II toxin-antitoxin system RelE/ParE family toxin n=1 Tax=Rhizobium skierniewicense TaxID=984260 RepID=UPI0015733E8A|nr:type II toxin-antitoxin system RelE/ParE family toxin [Rhizobium skierniewicense]NTF33414.1 type II toxin-antitoxin system RelE/ParE family toxin [Rhizobium skierniewicense]